jgi:putative transposase
MELCRYVELSPVRAGMVARPADWLWSSYRAPTGLCLAPPWLDLVKLHSFVLGQPVTCAADHARAAMAYAELVVSAPDQRLWDDALRQQIYSGGQSFIDQVQAQMEGKSKRALAIPRLQRLKCLSLSEWLTRTESREQALWMAHTQSGLSLTAMAAELGLSVSRVSQLVKRAEKLLVEGAEGSCGVKE